MARGSAGNWNASDIATDWVTGMGSAKAQAAYVKGTAGKGGAAMAAASTTTALASYSNGCANSVTNGSRLASLQNPQAAALYNANTGQAGASRLGPGAMKKKAKYQAQLSGLIGMWGAMQDASAGVDSTKQRSTAEARMVAALQVAMAYGKKAGT